jgi:trehalose 6-phosphate phosphatase
MDVDAVITALRPLLDGALIATDFDGTLAPLVVDPEDSRPVTGAVEALVAITRCGARVAVITGRDARTVLRLGGLEAVPGIVVAGLYGIETWTDGVLTTPDEPAEILALRDRLPAVLADVPADPAVWIEDKRLSLVVHARRAADADAALAALHDPVTALATELALEIHPGSGVLELRLPGYDKARTLARLADGHDAVLYLGDDLGDLPAFSEIKRLRDQGRTAYSVAVLESHVHGVAEAADVTVPTAHDAVALLNALSG